MLRMRNTFECRLCDNSAIIGTLTVDNRYKLDRISEYAPFYGRGCRELASPLSVRRQRSTGGRHMISRAGLVFATVFALASAGAAHAQQRQQQQQQQQQQQAPAAPQRTEILSFDNWSVTCAEFEGAKRPSCNATLRVTQGKSRQVVFAWTIATAGNAKLSSALVTPTGVRVDQGIEIRFGKGKPRKVGYTTCDAQRCTGALTMDEAIVKEAAASGQAEATIQAVDGRSIKFTFPVKGVDRAVAHLRKS
jgi:invasion protein IalB